MMPDCLRACCHDAIREAIRECIEDFAGVADPELEAHLALSVELAIRHHECAGRALP